MQSNPLVSIIIPVYNGANYMCEAIDSALAQTYSNVEVLVVNDGSIDNTEEIALSYGDKIRYYKKENGGQSSALNFGIEQMKGEYFSWLSHDDVYYPEKLEHQIKELSHYSESNIILYSDYDVINNESVKISEGLTKDTISDRFRLQLMIASPINGCTALIPRSAFTDIGMFNTKRPHTSDVEAFFNMAGKYRFVHSSKRLVMSRQHSGQMTHKRAKYHNYESNLFLIDTLNKMQEADYIKADEKHPDILFEIAKNWAQRGYKNAYIKAYKKFKEASKKNTTRLNSALALRRAYMSKYLKSRIKYLIYTFRKW
jgi:glycosyltransferase involved in cell wall biosynthesis